MDVRSILHVFLVGQCTRLTAVLIAGCKPLQAVKGGTAFLRALVSSLLVVSLWVNADLSHDALPQGANVVHGDVSVSSNQNSMTINQTSYKGIVEWQNFNIGENASVVVNQPDTGSSLLNRVIGADPSKILGSLKANGQIILINPNGVVFGPNSRIDVGSIVASSLQLSNEDFLQNRYQFTGGGLAAGIQQLGTINADSVALVAASIVNQGSINAESGVVLATGEKVQISFDGRNLISVDLC